MGVFRHRAVFAVSGPPGPHAGGYRGRHGPEPADGSHRTPPPGGWGIGLTGRLAAAAVAVASLVAVAGVPAPGRPGPNPATWTAPEPGHGPDAAIGGIGAVINDQYTGPPPARYTRSAVACSTGPAHPLNRRFVAIYAVPADAPNAADDTAGRTVQMVQRIRQALYDASGFMDDEADVPGVPVPVLSRQRIRLLCDDPRGVPVVHTVQLKADSDMIATGRMGYQGIKHELLARFDDEFEKYVVFYDGAPIPVRDPTGAPLPVRDQNGQVVRDASGAAVIAQYAGVGDVCPDESPGPSNCNNTQRSGGEVEEENRVRPAYAIDFFDDYKPEPNWYTFLHEMAHTMGAVQNNAPHSNSPPGPAPQIKAVSMGHCTDDDDVLCYDETDVDGNGDGLAQGDGPGDGLRMTQTCAPLRTLPPLLPGTPTQRLGRFDCGHDDYFNAHPAADTYLASHWNIASIHNQFVDHDWNLGRPRS